MKFTLDWLYQYIEDKGVTPQELADRLTMLGLEVDSVTPLSEGLEDIAIAQITAVRKHPNADRLTLCDVNVGEEEIIQVVCGAPNVRENMFTAIARPGATLPGGLKIKKAKVRGELSYGMLCSSRELGLNDDHSGILDLQLSAQPGSKLIDALHLNDTVIEIDLTPNRPDCASVIGIAREVAAFTHQVLRHPVEDVPELGSNDLDFSVRIDEPYLCPRYSARKLTNVVIKESPQWLQNRLTSVGMRPINNIVDITNFVMLEYGQPLHAFDCKKISDSQIIVRCPTETETTFTTLDGKEREIDPEMLMICDSKGPVAVGGVMGGLNSEVDDSTTEILLEAACFNPVSIRRTARRLNLPSEASYRFERGVDPDNVIRGLERAVQLMVELADADLAPSGIDLYPGKKDLLRLELRVKKVNDLLGIDLSADEISEYLQSIEFQAAVLDDSVLDVTVPSFRVDIEREVDLVEEIARLVGYNDIPLSMPTVVMDYPVKDSMLQLRSELADMLTSFGFTEAINYSFASPNAFDLLGLDADDARRNTVALLNPLNEEQSVLRTMLLPGLLENLQRNMNFQQTDIRLFEIGKTFHPENNDPQPVEKFYLNALLCGKRNPAQPAIYSTELVDFFDIKGVGEAVLQRLGLLKDGTQIQFTPCASSSALYIDPDCCMEIQWNNDRIGIIGKINDSVAKNYSIKQDVYFFELNLGVINRIERANVTFESLPRFPSVNRDIALLVPEQVAAGDLLDTVRSYDNDLVESIDIFDVYSGDKLDKGTKSVALSVSYRSKEKTLDDETVDTVHEKIVQLLMAKYDGRYREG